MGLSSLNKNIHRQKKKYIRISWLLAVFISSFHDLRTSCISLFFQHFHSPSYLFSLSVGILRVNKFTFTCHHDKYHLSLAREHSTPLLVTVVIFRVTMNRACRADCSCRRCHDTAVHIRACPTCAEPARLTGQLTGIVSNHEQWCWWQASIRPVDCSCRRGKHILPPHGAEAPDNI